MFSQFWTNLTKKSKIKLAIVAAALVVAGIIALVIVFSPGGEESQGPRKQSDDAC